MTFRQTINGINKTKDGDFELIFSNGDVILDDLQAEGQAYAAAPLTYRLYPRKPGVEMRSTGRGFWEATFTYGPVTQDEEEPGSLGTIEIDGAGGTQHTNQCISQIAFPEGKFQGLVDAKVVGWHRDGVNGTDVDIPGTTYTLTRKWLPNLITGDYLKGLGKLRGKTNRSPYTISWIFQQNNYSIEFDEGELRFLNHRAKTDFTKNGVGVWEISYSFLYSENLTDFDLGKTKDGTEITADIQGHEYVWFSYEKKEITAPPATIEVPEAAFISQMYRDEDFQTVLGF
jgi:hypothetical protein